MTQKRARLITQDEHDEAAYKQAKAEERAREQIERQVAEQLRNGATVVPPKAPPPLPGVTSLAAALSFLEQTYTLLAAAAETKLTEADLEHELPAVRLELARLWCAIKQAVRVAAKDQTLAPAALASLVDHLSRYLAQNVEEQVESAALRQRYNTGRAVDFVREWQRTAARQQQRQTQLDPQVAALLYGDDDAAAEAFFGHGDGSLVEHELVGPRIYRVNIVPGPEES